MTSRRVTRSAFWVGVAEGLSTQDAARRAGTSWTVGKKWMRQVGGVIPTHLVSPLSERFLSPTERASIMVGLEQGMSVRAVARMIGRAPSTVSRELARNRSRYRRYDAARAQLWAEKRTARPKPSKLALNAELHAEVQAGLDRKWSPQQIVARLREDFAGREDMQVSHETIYRSLYVQARGSLKRELVAKVRTGRTMRKPRNQAAGDGRKVARIPGMVMISERPAEVADRAIPGHWEGDLIIGKDNRSQIGTLVERSTRYVLLLHLPESRDPEIVADAMIEAAKTLPKHLMRSLTWDQGMELQDHQRITVDADLPIYFCDPASPWQRGSNENTNGLLRQYFPKSTDLSQHSAEHLACVAAELNGRPRQTLGWKTPAEAFEALLLSSQQAGVATTP